jgi:predicted RecB family nuclease
VKKSEFIERYIDSGTAGWRRRAAERAAEMAEAAGVVWDPEEELLPATVYLCNEDGPANDSAAVQDGGSMSGSYYFWVIRGHRRGGNYSRRVAQEAVRRWNAWAEIRALVDCLGDDGSPGYELCPEDRARRKRLISIIDGKEVP